MKFNISLHYMLTARYIYCMYNIKKVTAAPIFFKYFYGTENTIF